MSARPLIKKAGKQTVSLTINSDLFAQAKSFRINVSQIAQDALAREVAARKAELLKSEIRQDLEACSLTPHVTVGGVDHVLLVRA
jgi:post-segregation antitoxin (ccd killing protein)